MILDLGPNEFNTYTTPESIGSETSSDVQKKGNLIKKREKQKKEQKTEWHRKNNSND